MKKIVQASVVIALMTAHLAFADTIVWKDPVYNFTMSYPDSWRVQTVDSPLTRLRVAGPYKEDWATCKMKVAKDRRAVIYPKDLTDDFVRRELGPSFWEGELAVLEDVQVDSYYDPASLGKGDATGVRVSYARVMPEIGRDNIIPMYGVMLASIYGDMRYVMSCSSTAVAYERWAPVFASVMDSVEFEARYHPFKTGYYRDFLADPKLHLKDSKPGDRNMNKSRTWWQDLEQIMFSMDPIPDAYHRDTE